MRENGFAEVQAVGAGAVNQAVKAIAITRGFIAPNGVDLVTIPAFVESISMVKSGQQLSLLLSLGKVVSGVPQALRDSRF